MSPKLDDGTPFISFGADELAAAAPIATGDKIDCPRCGEQHEVRDGVPGGHLQFYRCFGETYLCGVGGKSVMR